jgi:hypothetical protein
METPDTPDGLINPDIKTRDPIGVAFRYGRTYV